MPALEKKAVMSDACVQTVLNSMELVHVENREAFHSAAREASWVERIKSMASLEDIDKQLQAFHQQQ
eukprot:12640790-Prorocentrum_lima.AAC.1